MKYKYNFSILLLGVENLIIITGGPQIQLILS